MNGGEENNAMRNNFRHKLWLIYSQLKDAESDPARHIALLQQSREELGQIINELNGTAARKFK